MLAVGRNADGRLEAFLPRPAGGVWHQWQNSAGGSWFGQWDALDGPAPAAGATVGSTSDGRLQVLIADSSGAVHHRWQTAPNNGWSSNWASLGAPIPMLPVGPPAIGMNADGHLEVFVCTHDGALWHAWETSPNSASWTPWTSFGKPAANVLAFGRPAIGVSPDGRLEVFVAASDGAVWHLWQGSAGNWSSWTSHGQPVSHQSWLFLPTGPPVVGTNEDGRLEVRVTAGGQLWVTWQNTPGGSWFGQWVSQATNVASNPAVARNEDRRLEVFFAQNGSFGPLMAHIWQTSINNGWSSPTALVPSPLGGEPVAAANKDGSLDLFWTVSGGGIMHVKQTAPNNGWGQFAGLGNPNQANTPAGPTCPTGPFAGLQTASSDFKLFTDSFGWHLATANGQQRTIASGSLVSTAGTSIQALFTANGKTAVVVDKTGSASTNRDAIWIVPGIDAAAATQSGQATAQRVVTDGRTDQVIQESPDSSIIAVPHGQTAPEEVVYFSAIDAHRRGSAQWPKLNGQTVASNYSGTTLNGQTNACGGTAEFAGNTSPVALSP
jgi:hypothetical protein